MKAQFRLSKGAAYHNRLIGEVARARMNELEELAILPFIGHIIQKEKPLTIILLAGCDLQELKATVQSFRSQKLHVAVVMDTLAGWEDDDPELVEYLGELDDSQIQLLTVGNVVALEKADTHAVSVFSTRKNSAAIIVLRNWWTRDPLVLAIIRDKPEPKGLALPSGFQRGAESLAECAARKCHLETGVRPDPKSLFACAENSNCKRDPLYPVNEQAFLWRVPAEESEQVCLQVVSFSHAASSVLWTRASNFLSGTVMLPGSSEYVPVAFQHHQEFLIKGLWLNDLLRW